MAERRTFHSSKDKGWEATVDAKAQANRMGLRIRTVAKVSGRPGDWTVELAVDAQAER
jgi:hypothetical protein